LGPIACMRAETDLGAGLTSAQRPPRQRQPTTNTLPVVLRVLKVRRIYRKAANRDSDELDGCLSRFRGSYRRWWPW
jgi:hypothetical protein